ncbi:MAG: 2-oxoacid:ferredoxin oxidoreductase subunit beta, partial [Deltaproteobacteria bacterium]|nr:2-oxoacid:ferredoxin oxidoreductase subunit beta [Deltaproteobacteria bacterium]
LAVVSGIGCSSRFPYYINSYGFHSIHGRAFAVATGLKVSRPDLSVWVATGDGDALSIGGNHFIHVCRRNVDLQILMFNNRIYGLTKGQYSPTSEFGKKTKSTPMGSIDHPFQPGALALGADASFVGRTVDIFTKDQRDVLKAAHEHKGTSFVEIYQNCNIFNDGAWDALTDKAVREDRVMMLEHGKPMTFAGGTRGIKLNGIRPEVVELGNGLSASDCLVHDERDPFLAAIIMRMDYPAFPVPMGVLYRNPRPTYEVLANEQIVQAKAERTPNLQKLLSGGDTWTVK